MVNTSKYMNYPVSQERLMHNLNELCKWERLSGTAEELESFRYMEKELQVAGAETELVFADAYISLPISSKLVVDGKEYYCNTASMAKSTPPDGETGTLAYAEKVTDITEDNCKGKIVLLGGEANYTKIDKAWKKGAKAVIGCTGEHIHQKIISNAWGSPSVITRELIPDVPYVTILEKDKNELCSIIAEKNVEAQVTTVVETGWKKIPILFGTVKSDKATEDYVQFSGHIDSWFYGATDNGTANCIQLEAARIAYQNKDKLNRNVKIVYYSGHSHGRYAGSAWHVDHYWMDLNRHCVININCDIVGGVGATDLTRSIIMPECRQVAVQLIDAYTGIKFNGGRCGRNGDQSYYITGVSSAFSSFSKQPRPDNPEGKLTQTRSGAFDFGWWWHNEADLIDKVNPEFFLRDAKIFISYVMCFAIEEEIPLDFHATAIELKSLVEYWIEHAQNRFDLTELLSLSDKLIEVTEKVYETHHEDIDRFNRLQMKLGRILVPMNYTTGNLYENDNGIPKPPMPALMLIDDLVKTPEGSSDGFDIIVELTHKRNYLIDSFTRAIELVQDFIDG